MDNKNQSNVFALPLPAQLGSEQQGLIDRARAIQARTSGSSPEQDGAPAHVVDDTVFLERRSDVDQLRENSDELLLTVFEGIVHLQLGDAHHTLEPSKAVRWGEALLEAGRKARYSGPRSVD